MSKTSENVHFVTSCTFSLAGWTKLYSFLRHITNVQGVIVSNALLFMCKIRKFPSFLLLYIRQVIDENAPVPGSTYETCHSWLAAYGGSIHRKSIFFKGLLLSIKPSFADLTTPETSPINIESLKRKIKTIMLDLQASGENAEWTSNNFCAKLYSRFTKFFKSQFTVKVFLISS